eukprot:scaffold14939_cov215-Amphora_coffeaeformis.AAC.4
MPSGNYLWSYTQYPWYSIIKLALPTSMTSGTICSCFSNDPNNEYRKKAFRRKIRLEKKDSDDRVFVYMKIRMRGKVCENLEVRMVDSIADVNELGDHYKNWKCTNFDRYLVVDMKTPAKLWIKKDAVKTTIIKPDPNEKL